MSHPVFTYHLCCTRPFIHYRWMCIVQMVSGHWKWLNWTKIKSIGSDVRKTHSFVCDVIYLNGALYNFIMCTRRPQQNNDFVNYYQFFRGLSKFEENYYTSPHNLKTTFFFCYSFHQIINRRNWFCLVVECAAE